MNINIQYSYLRYKSLREKRSLFYVQEYKTVAKT